MTRPPANNDLQDLTIAVPESRQLDILVELLERRGATVQRLPLITILDAEDTALVENWLRRFIDQPGDLFIVLTGEGIRRLRGFAERAGMEEAFRQALGQIHKLCRGPKPGRALKEMDLKADSQGTKPTTEGIIEALSAMDEEQPLTGQRVYVQLYGEDPNRALMEFLAAKGAEAIPVAPYRYTPASDEGRILDFIQALHRGEIDAVTFTSQPQFKRLLNVARKNDLEEALIDGLQRTLSVAVGPVVGDQLAAHDIEVKVMPEEQYFMKPMVTALARHVRSR
ncbi:MAG: uroporphyrinogen-III synthase [Pseudomonadota bacterium]